MRIIPEGQGKIQIKNTNQWVLQCIFLSPFVFYVMCNCLRFTWKKGIKIAEWWYVELNSCCFQSHTPLSQVFIGHYFKQEVRGIAENGIFISRSGYSTAFWEFLLVVKHYLVGR